MNNLSTNLFLLISVLVCFTTLISMCSTLERSTDNVPINVVTHANGLQIHLPQDLSAETEINGFSIQERNSQELRFPTLIMVNLSSEQEFSEETWNESKEIGGKTVDFRIEETGGGSGGQIYALTVRKPVDGGEYIYLKQEVQSEAIRQPDFNIGWTIIKEADVVLSGE